MDSVADTRKNRHRGLVGTSLTLKRSMKIGGRRTSVSIEQPFFDALQDIAASRGMPVATLVSTIDRERQHDNLSSAIRVFVLEHYRGMAEQKRRENNG